ncbi:MAG TPA: hypothetical protein VFT20_00120 [Candidatus Limnocylindrales bacterium]|nr:hypothetical protein [Candidatus Limnocylindrales bacterium]
MAALALHWRLGSSDDPHRQPDPHAQGPRREAVAGDDRRADRPRRSRRPDVPREGRARLGFTPIAPLYRVEHAFARLGRWRRLSRCYEGTSEGARAWLEVAALAYLFARLRIELA